MDKSAGTITRPAGFTDLLSQSSTSLSTYIGYKIATGGETTITVSRSNASTSGDTAWVGEFADSGAGTGPFVVISTATHGTDESTVTSWASGTAADPVRTCAAIAFFGIDSGSSGSGSQTFGGSFSQLNGWANSSLGDIAVGWVASQAGGSTVACTHTHTSTADQVSGAIATFGRSVALAGTQATTAALSGDLAAGISGAEATTATLTGGLLLGVALTGTRATAATLTGDLTTISRIFTGTLEIEFTAGVWTDVTSRLAFSSGPLTIRQGRTTEFDDVGAGTLTCTLYDDDGALMPDNTASIYYPNFVEGIRIRWKVTKSSVTYSRFVGWIQAIQPGFPDGSTYGSTVAISAVDALGLMALRKMRSNWTERALSLASAGAVSCDAYEANGVVNGFSAKMTNYSNNAAKGSPSYAYSGSWPTLKFASDRDVSIGGVVVVDVDSNGDACITTPGFQANCKTIQYLIKTPSNIPGATPWFLGSFEDVSQVALAHLVLESNGAGDGRLAIYNAAGSASLGTVKNPCVHGQWITVRLTQNAGTASHCDVTTVDLGSGATGSLSNIALDVRVIRFMELPRGTGKTQPSSYGGIIALGQTAGPAVADAIPAGAQGTLSTRLDTLTAALGTLPIASAKVGSLATQVVTGLWSDRSALEIAQEMMRGNWGVAWARSRDSSVHFIDSASCRPAVPIATIDTDADCDGPPRLARVVDSRPTRVEVQSPIGTTLVIDAAAEAGPGTPQRLKTIATVNASPTDDTTAANLALSSSSKLRISQIAVDLIAGQTDHTTELLSESGTLTGLFPTQCVRTVLPPSHFGAPTRDHHVQGWSESYHPQYVRFTLDTTPAAAVTLDGPETFTGSNGSGFSGATFSSRVDVNGTGSALIQGNRGRVTTAAAAAAGCYAVFNTTADDMEITGLFQLQSASSRAVVILKSASIDGTGYIARVGTSGTAELLRNGSVVATWAETVASGTDYQIRFRAAGAYINVRVWAAAGSEPGGWDLAYVDASPLSGTQAGIGAQADGSTATARAVDWDNVTITTPS
jgi:hypothetical protein